MQRGKRGWKIRVHCLLFEAFSLAASIIKYSSTSSTEVSSILLVALEVLF